MGKNARVRKEKKVQNEVVFKQEIKRRQKEKFNSYAVPITRTFLTIVLTILLIFGSKIIMLNLRGGDDQMANPSKSNIAVIETDKGNIRIELKPESAPKTVENFKTLIDRGYYNGLTWHRVVKDFVIQGGDPKGDGTGGESAWGDKFADEINPKSLGLDDAKIKELEEQGYVFDYNLTSLPVNVGAVAMANSGPNTNGSQFFIVTSQNQDHLNGKHTVFGQVIEGLDVANTIEQGEIIKRIYLENNAS